MVILCDSKHHQKLKLLISLKHKRIMHILKLALEHLMFKCLFFGWCLGSHKTDLQKGLSVRRNFHKNSQSMSSVICISRERYMSLLLGCVTNYLSPERGNNLWWRNQKRTLAVYLACCFRYRYPPQ